MGAASVGRGEIPAGLFLGIDTSGREGAVALARLFRSPNGGIGRDRGPAGDPERDSTRDDTPRMEILASTRLRAEEEHASLLIPSIGALLEDVGVFASDLAGLVVGAGPGSFTGVRVGAATAKGLAWSLGLPFWALSSLAGAAAALDDETARPRMVLFDARGDRLYAAAYRFNGLSMETLLAPQATTVGQILDDLMIPGALLLGDGAVRHRALLESAGNPVHLPPAGRSSAEGLLRILACEPAAMPIADVGPWEPEYLRESGAERMWKTKSEQRGP